MAPGGVEVYELRQQHGGMNAAVDQVISEVKRSRSPGATREGGDGAEKEGDALYCPFQDSEVAVNQPPAKCSTCWETRRVG